MPRIFLFSFLMLAVSAALAASNGAIVSKSKEGSVTIEGLSYLPFGIGPQTPLDSIRITLAFHSAKTGVGPQEIILKGNGSVRLSYLRSLQDKAPKILEGNCGSAAVIRLLDLMEGNGVLEMPDQFGGAPKGRSERVLELTLPGRSKRISVAGEGEGGIEQVIGAVSLAAGQCLPEALNHRFFPNL
jgi:hypothetical protein